MIKKTFIRYASAVAVVVVLTTAPARADLIGHYRVSGIMPDGSNYSGEVAVELVGNTFHVVRDVAGQHDVATGIGYRNVLAVSYRSGDATMLALYTQDDTGRWTGTWTRVGTNQTGSERWQPHAPHRQDNQVSR